VSEVDFNPEYIARIIPKLDWTVLWKAAESVRSHLFIYTIYSVPFYLENKPINKNI